MNSESTDKLFEKSQIYQPDYFPKGMHIDIRTNQEYPNLPWTFRLPYRGKKKVHNEPIEHNQGIQKLTRTEFEIPFNNKEKEFKNYFISNENIVFKNGSRNHLTLEFDNLNQKKSMDFKELNLTIKY
jgi:hypothetical protein